VICSDKTGTLTRNEMMVRRLLRARYDPHRRIGLCAQGGLTSEGAEDDADAIAAASAILRCGMLCNDATLKRDAGQWKVDGDPMEGALVALAMKAGLNPDHLRAEWKRLDEIPFDAAYRFMATLHAGPRPTM
jgi:magnesium-transporting ATPase (P-type)